MQINERDNFLLEGHQLGHLTADSPFLSFAFQSLLDFSCSSTLLVSTVTIIDYYKIHNTGILGWMECHLWNNELLPFGFFLSSTWNIVVLTVERFVSLKVLNRYHRSDSKSYLSGLPSVTGKCLSLF